MSSSSFRLLQLPSLTFKEIIEKIGIKEQMSSSSFPLLRLPSLALKEIIEKVELKEQFNLSRCSKRMYYVVKYYRGKLPLSLKLIGSKDYTEMYIFNPKNLKNAVGFEVRADGIYRFEIFCWDSYSGKFIKEAERFKEAKRLYFIGKNVIQGTKFLVELLYDLFEAKAEEVSVDDESIWMLDFVEERQGGYSYDAVVPYNGRSNNEQSKHILLDLKPRSLCFSQTTSSKFRVENFHKKYENLTIGEGRWMTVENLCQLDCVKIEVNGQYFSNTEINRYLRHVLSGGAPRLREFSAAVHKPIEDMIMDGVQELLIESERFEDEFGDWEWNGKVAGGEGLVSIKLTGLAWFRQTVHLEMK